MPKTRFSGHEGFALRASWPLKAVRATLEDPQAFVKPSSIVRFGVGKNMVQSIRYWALNLGLIEFPEKPGYARVTDVGEALFGPDDPIDPYLVRHQTLWILHYLLTTGHDVPNSFGRFWGHYPGSDFTDSSLTSWFTGLEEDSTGGISVSPRSISRDVAMITRVYRSSLASTEKSHSDENMYESPFVDLGLLSPGGSGRNRISYARPNLPPDGLLAYAVEEFWQRHRQDLSSITFENLAFDEQSPGRVFAISPQTLAESLVRISQQRVSIVFDETAGLRAIYKGKQFGKQGRALVDWLDDIYGDGEVVKDER